MKHITTIRNRLVRALGGYATPSEAIEAIRKEDLGSRKLVLTAAVRRLFSTIGPDDILREGQGGEWILEGKAITPNLKGILIAEARQFSESKLWAVLQKDVKWQANKRMFVVAKDELDMVAGKLWVYTLDAMRTRLESLGTEHGTFNTR